MSSWATLEANALAAQFAAFGEPITYTPTGGSPVSIDAVLDVGSHIAQAGGGVFGTASIRIADLAAYPLKGDVVTMPAGMANWPAGDYSVQDVERGTIGEVLVVLRKKL